MKTQNQQPSVNTITRRGTAGHFFTQVGNSSHRVPTGSIVMWFYCRSILLKRIMDEAKGSGQKAKLQKHMGNISWQGIFAAKHEICRKE